MTSRWRSIARPIIAAVLGGSAGLPEKEIRRALRAAYPFGIRKHHPYRIWCDEIRRQRGLKPLSRHAPQELRLPDARQEEMRFENQS